MKKILSFTLILASVLAFDSCKNEEDLIFDKTAAEDTVELGDPGGKARLVFFGDF